MLAFVSADVSAVIVDRQAKGAVTQSPPNQILSRRQAGHSLSQALAFLKSGCPISFMSHEESAPTRDSLRAA